MSGKIPVPIPTEAGPRRLSSLSRSEAPARPDGTVRAVRAVMAFAVVLPMLLFGVAALEDRAVDLQRADEDARKILTLMHEQAAYLFNAHETLLNVIVERVRGLDWTEIESSRDFLHDVEMMDGEIDDASAIILVDAEGLVRQTTAPSGASAQLSGVDADCFRLLRDGVSTTCVTQPFVEAASHQILFSLARRLEADGAFRGVAQIAISIDYFHDIWGAALPHDTDIVILARADGAVIARYPTADGKKLRLDADEPLMTAIRHSDEGIIRGRSPGDDVDRIVVYKRIAKYPVYLGIGIDKDAALGEWYHGLVVYGAVALVATIALMMAAGIALRRAQRERDAIGLWHAEVKEREAMQAQLLQSQKMEALGTLAGGIAHDLNNALVPVIGLSNVLSSRAPEGSRDRVALALIEESGLRARDMVQRILMFSRRTEPERRHLDIGVFVANALRLLRASIPATIVVLEKIAPTPLVLADEGQLHQVLMNLVANAAQAIGDKMGTITVEVGPVADVPGSGGDGVRVAVSDTGSGMDEATRQRIFEPFFTTKAVGEGTGLGLSVVHGIIVSHGGCITVESVPGEGSCFAAYLPIAAETGAAETQAAA
jgi:signal transduction histidine kinase